MTRLLGNGEVQEQVRDDVPGDAALGAGLQVLQFGVTARVDDLAPRLRAGDTNNHDVPPLSRVAVGGGDEVAVRRQRDVGRARAKDGGQVDGGRVVDAVTRDRALQRGLA